MGEISVEIIFYVGVYNGDNKLNFISFNKRSLIYFKEVYLSPREYIEILCFNVPELKNYSYDGSGEKEKFEKEYSYYRFDYRNGNLVLCDSKEKWVSVTPISHLESFVYVRKKSIPLDVGKEKEEILKKFPHLCFCDGKCNLNTNDIGLRKNIVGFRYGCLECPEYNICDKCMRENQHSNHVLVRLPFHQFWVFSLNRGTNSTSSKSLLHQDNVANGEDVPFTVCCYICNETVTRFLHKCIQCPNVVLCENCVCETNHITLRVPASNEWIDLFSLELEYSFYLIGKFVSLLDRKHSIERLPTFLKQVQEVYDEEADIQNVKRHFGKLNYLRMFLSAHTEDKDFLQLPDTIKFKIVRENGIVIHIQTDIDLNNITSHWRRKLSLSIVREEEVIFQCCEFYWKNKNGDNITITGADDLSYVVLHQMIEMGMSVVTIFVKKNAAVNTGLEKSGLTQASPSNVTEYQNISTAVPPNHNHGTVWIEGEEIKEICCECGRRKDLYGVCAFDAWVTRVNNLKTGSVIQIDIYKKKFFLPNDVAITDDMFGLNDDTFFHFASEWNIVWMFKRILMETSIDVDARNEKGETLLMKSCKKGRVGITKLLLDNGATVTGRNVFNKTALHYVASSNNVDIFQLLLEHGADVNAKDKDGCSILHEALYWYSVSSPSFIKYLLSIQSWDLEDTDAFGSTPVMLAINKEDIEVIQLLLDSGSNLVYSDELIWSPLHFVAEGNVSDDIRNFVLSKVCEEKRINKKELIEWMIHSAFSEATDYLGWKFAFNTFKFGTIEIKRENQFKEDILFVLLALEDDIPFSTIGPFGIPLDVLIYRAVNNKPIYKERKAELDILLGKLRRKSLMDFHSKPKEGNFTESFHLLHDYIRTCNYGTCCSWKSLEEHFSPLVHLDWLKPVMFISIRFQYSKWGPHYTSILSPQVQLAMQPHTAYKEIVAMKEGESLLHVAAEYGNELFLLMGAKNVQDVKKRLPYQCAEGNGHCNLGQFILEYYEVQGLDGLLTKDDDEDLQHSFSSFSYCIDFNNLQIYDEIPEIKPILDKIKIAIESDSKGTTDKKSKSSLREISDTSDIDPKSSIRPVTSKTEKTLLRMEAERELQSAVNKTVDERFPGYERYFTDGSVAPKSKFSGVAHCNFEGDKGAGYNTEPINIHNAELLALKIALEEIEWNENTAVLSDRQAMLKALNTMAEMFTHRSNIDYIILNWIILFRLLCPPNPKVEIGVQWIPAHDGLEGNDIVDELAKKAMKEGRKVEAGEVATAVVKKREGKKKMESTLMAKRETKRMVKDNDFSKNK